MDKAELVLPKEFQHSYQNFQSYPENLVCRLINRAALHAYVTRLDTQEGKLFAKAEKDSNVAFRDYRPSGQGRDFQKQNIFSDDDMKRWIGDQSTKDPLTLQCTGLTATKADPKCRFIFIWATHSRAILKITRQMLVRILSYHQVMPEYLDFMSVFGLQSRQRDIFFSGFRVQSRVDNVYQGSGIPSLHRSGRTFQLCYNVKTVGIKTSDSSISEKKEWSIRQAAFHHQFDIDQGTTLWIITRGDKDIKQRIEDLTGAHGRPEDKSFHTIEACLKSSLAIHILNAHWSMENWRWHIEWLEEEVEEMTQIALQAPRDPDSIRRKYGPGDIQALYKYAYKANEATMVLEANCNVFSSLKTFYDGLLKKQSFPLNKEVDYENIISEFGTQLDAMIYDSKMQMSRAKVLTQIISETKSLISQHFQSQASEKMEEVTMNMHEIGISSQKETVLMRELTLSMHEIAILSQKETIAMRIITVVTLVYLPPTFVSTFFSTDVVKYQTQEATNGNFSRMAMNRWLQVTLPLTLVTLVIGYLAFRYEDQKHTEKLQAFRKRSMPSA